MSSGIAFAFGAFELDPGRRRLTASGEPIAISDRHLDVLLLLVARAGQTVSKDDLLQAGWKDVAVGDNSLEQAISSLRRVLGAHPDGANIDTVPRRGYRFSTAVTRRTARESDAGLDALLAPHRAFIEGRAALETLEAGHIAQALEVFEAAVLSAPEHASSHIGLANACAMRFEMTRADAAPDLHALGAARQHAREACRLDPQSGEAWATLGFVLDRSGERLDALAASKRAVTLEPDNWRHHCRLSYVGWGEERLRAAQRTLALLPDFPMAHWFAATVHVARQAIPEAERELIAGLHSHTSQAKGDSRFGSVALHWLSGLLHLERGDDARALEEFHRELETERQGNLYARECCANAWYAIGALRLRQDRPEEAEGAFRNALQLVANHRMARVGIAAVSPPAPDLGSGSIDRPETGTLSVEAAIVWAAHLVTKGDHAKAAQLVASALASAPAGNAGWLLPVEPLLHVSAHMDVWAPALASIRSRAA